MQEIVLFSLSYSLFLTRTFSPSFCLSSTLLQTFQLLDQMSQELYQQLLFITQGNFIPRAPPLSCTTEIWAYEETYS